MGESFKLSLPPPAADFLTLTSELARTALDYAQRSPRKRVIMPFHKGDSDPLHRMFNAVQPGSYVRPHRHIAPPRAEAFLVLRGALAFFVFDDDGGVRDCVRIAAGSDCFGIDLAPGLFHSFLALEPDTLLYEVKSGPYEPSHAKDFAPWAPAEGAPDAARYMQELRAAFDAHAAR